MTRPASTENASATHARVVRRVETRRSHHASIASRFRVPTSSRAAHLVYTSHHEPPHAQTPKHQTQKPQTQAYQTQLDTFDAQAVITRVSDEERDALVAEVMRLMLFSQYRDGAPVPRADISKLVSSHSQARGTGAVSYTHLTLPTILRV